MSEAATTIDITRADPADAERLGAILARAFHEDPVFGWLITDPDRRRERLPAVFGAFAHLYLTRKETYLAGNGVGAALWAPPGGPPFAEDDMAQLGERLAAAMGDDAERALELDAVLAEHHPDDPSFYLQFMGVVPDHQGRGIGSRLLATVLRRCDHTAIPAYLEATSVANRRLYERHGFERIAEISLPDGPPLWSMWREPQTTSG